MANNRGGTLIRSMTALVLIPLTLALIWVPYIDSGFSLFITLLGALGLQEFYAMACAKGLSVENRGGIVAGSVLILSGHFGSPPLTAMMLFLSFTGLAWLHLLRRNHSLVGFAGSVFGLVYVGWLASYFVLLHRVPILGPGLVTLLLVAVGLADTGAYFVGKSIGRHKLAPSVSPNKTIEGAAGGIVCAVVGLVVIHGLRNEFEWSAFPMWTLPRYVLTGILLALLSQIGDLAESMMKRDAGIKDSGEIFPGHGGVLDRCDGFLFTAPMLYCLVVI